MPPIVTLDTRIERTARLLHLRTSLRVSFESRSPDRHNNHIHFAKTAEILPPPPPPSDVLCISLSFHPDSVTDGLTHGTDGQRLLYNFKGEANFRRI